VAITRVDDAEAAIRQEQEDTETAENAELTTREPGETVPEMMVAIGNSLSNTASSDDGDDGDDEDDEETEQGMLSKDDEPGWVMGTISKTAEQWMESFREMQMKLDELTQPGWEDSADYVREIHAKYSTSELQHPTFVKPQTDDDVAAPSTTSFGELMECPEIVPVMSWMPQRTSRQGSSNTKLGSGKTESDTGRASLAPAVEHESSPIQNAKTGEPVCFYPCILPPQLNNL